MFLSTIPLFMMVGKDFLPQDDQSEFEVTVNLPPGSSLAGIFGVREAAGSRTEVAARHSDMLTVLGADQRRQVDRGSILIELVDPKQREQIAEGAHADGARDASASSAN